MNTRRARTWARGGPWLAVLLCGAGCPPAMDRARPGAEDLLRLDVPRLDVPRLDVPRPDVMGHDLSAHDTTTSDVPASDAPAPEVPGPWVTLPAGTFDMGSPASERCREVDERQHQVKLTRPFEIMTREVTQGQFSAVMGYNPSGHTTCGLDCPVEQVSWHMAVDYCNHLSARAGFGPCYSCTGSGASVVCQESAGPAVYACPGYRLPTEAEWEYARRAGAKAAFDGGDLASDAECAACNAPGLSVLAPFAWYCATSSSQTHPVAGKKQNNWGLHDMAGNVWEWVGDWYDLDYGSAGATTVTDPWYASTKTGRRIVRGGGWSHSPRYLRAAFRRSSDPTENYDSFGFRCVRSR